MLPAREITGAEEYASQVDVDHRLPLGQAHLGHLAVLDLDGQAVAQDAGVVDQAIDGAEIFRHLCDHMGHLFFVGDVAQVRTGFSAGGFAGGHGFIEFFLVEVDQRQFGALGRQVFGHGATQTLAAASDDDDLVLQLHRLIPSKVVR